MTKVIIKEKESLEMAIRRLKLEINKNKIMISFKNHLFYKKPSLIKKEKKLESIKRYQKKIRIMYLKNMLIK